MLKHAEALTTEQAVVLFHVSFPGQGGDEIGEGEGVGEDVREDVGEGVREGVLGSMGR